MGRKTRARAILSGNILELYLFEEPLYYDFNTKRSESSLGREKTEEEKAKILKRSLGRTKSTLRRLVNTNSRSWVDNRKIVYIPKFVTLTFKKNLTELTIANKEYTNFVKRLNVHLYHEKKNRLRYVVVPEFQKRGAVHFHIIFFNLHWFKAKTLADIWGNGFINIRDISEVRNVGAYMTKYMAKDAFDKRLIGRKKYFSSRGLKKPVVVLDEQSVIQILESVKAIKPIYKHEYDTEYQGLTKYKIIDMAEHSEIKEAMLHYPHRIL